MITVSNSNPAKVHVDIELFSYDFKILNPRTFVSLQVTMESRLQASWAMLILLVGSTVAGSSDDFAKIRELTLSAECPIGAFLKSVFSEPGAREPDIAWSITCTDPVENPALFTCQWSDYSQDIEERASVRCPEDHGIAGVRNHPGKRMRGYVWSMKCCKRAGFKSSSCVLSDKKKNYDFTVPDGSIMDSWFSMLLPWSTDKFKRVSTCSYARQ